ncbi:MAG TPA: hypothetical protein VGK59_19320 [Ohtaekwangia sp.]
MKTTYLIFFLIAFASTVSLAQSVSTSTVQWNVTDVHNMNAGTHDGAGDKLISYPGDRVEWQDANGNLKFSFEIISTIGTWNNIAEGGFIHFNFRQEGQPGEVIIQRSGGAVSAEIQLYKTDATPQTYMLAIGSYTTL